MSTATPKPLSFSLDATGLLLPRRLRLQRALIVAAALLARLDNAQKSAPADLQPRFEAFKAQLVSDVDHIADSQRLAPESPPLSPPAEVLALVTAEVAASSRAVNNDIDNRVGVIMDAVRAHARRGPNHPKGAAALTLQAALFSDGLSFLNRSGPLQWLTVAQRFERAPAEVVTATQTLGVDDVLSEIQTMNAWFGRLLNITEAPDSDDNEDADPPAGAAADRRKAALDRLHATFANLISLANVAWPSSADQRPRVALLDPYLSAAYADTATRSQAIRDAAATKAPPPQG